MKHGRDYKVISSGLDGWNGGMDGWSSDLWNKLVDSASDAGQKLIDANKQKLLDKAQTIINSELQSNPDELAKAKAELAKIGTDTFRDFMSQNKWYFIGGGLALLGGVGAIVYYSRKK